MQTRTVIRDTHAGENPGPAGNLPPCRADRAHRVTKRAPQATDREITSAAGGNK